MNYLPLIFDGIIILIFVTCILDGRKKGFVRTVLSLLSVIISFIIAQSFSGPVAVWAKDNFAEQAVTAYVETYIEDSFQNNGIEPDTETLFSENIPEEVTALLEKYDVSLSSVDDEATNAIERLSKKVAQKVLDAVLLPILEALMFLIIYIVCASVLKLLTAIVCKAFRLPVIKQLNEMLGGILGAVKGIAVVSVLSIFCVIVSRLAAGNEVADALSQTNLINIIGETVISVIQGG